MFCNTFIKVNSMENLTEEFKQKREEILKENPHLLEKRQGRDNVMYVPFGMTELIRALRRMRETTPGQDIKIKQLSEELIILEVYTKMGLFPQSWKEALVFPIRKLGKDPSNPANIPIALTSHVGKVMEKVMMDKLVYILEKEGKL